MNKLLKQIVCGLLSISLAVLPSLGLAQANPASACNPSGVLFGFFNGVITTKKEAENAMKELKAIHGENNAAGEKIKYEVFYNYTNGLEDFVETFEQRLKEQGGVLEGRFELFFSALKGGGSWWTNIINVAGSIQGLLDGFNDFAKTATVTSLTRLVATPPTISNYAEHRLRIDSNALEGKKMLFVAHSQGNLFANSAYQYAITKLPTSAVKVVHIAPASPLVNGPHTLADLDLVINGLRLIGTVPSITHNIPGYLLRAASPLNDKKDFLGHGLLEIYINPLLAISSSVKSNINTALNALVAPPIQAASGFFTATLTWDGTGDVDLHVTEPSGKHVYWSYKTGQVGYLDVDNTYGYGPEHYYASCDVSKLQEGIYQVAVANFGGATGKVATVQIATSEGVLGTNALTLGAQTYSTPLPPMFNVNVKKNTQTGKFEASLM